MALTSRRRAESVNYWPGFVDALSTMLLVIIFLLSVFMLAQFFLSREVSGKDTALEALNRRVEELTSILALERGAKSDAEAKVSSLSATLSATTAENGDLKAKLDAQSAGANGADARVAAATDALDRQKALSADALAQVDALNQQISALRRQLAAIQSALDASQASDKESQEKISDLGSRLNVALAQRVQELSRYRSDFFGRLREILADRPEIRVVGDRFVFESSVLFDSAKAEVNPAGKQSLDTLAAAIIDLEREIPPDLPWILRIDGHTDSKAVTGGPFKSNWELSAARAVSVVQYLVQKGVDPTRLAAAGFGEFQPLETGTDPDALARNRRIELKLTER
jgi:chemotaxis protein MotB